MGMYIDYMLLGCASPEYEPIIEMMFNEGRGLRIKLVRLKARENDRFPRQQYQYLAAENVAGCSLSNLDLPAEMMTDLIKDAVDFFGPKFRAWYCKNVSKSQRGYLFYGLHVTGKTSSATALAAGLRLPVYVIDLAGMTNDEAIEHLKCLPEGGRIVVMEDLDCAGLVSTTEAEGKQNTHDDQEDVDRRDSAHANTSGVSISCLLEIDGVDRVKPIAHHHHQLHRRYRSVHHMSRQDQAAVLLLRPQNAWGNEW